jgi:hypothetical protein
VKVDPKLLRQRLRHIRNELGVLELRRSNIVAQGNNLKPGVLRRVKRRIAVLHNEEVAIREMLGEWQPHVKLIPRCTMPLTSVSWRKKGFVYGNEGRVAGTAERRSR